MPKIVLPSSIWSAFGAEGGVSAGCSTAASSEPNHLWAVTQAWSPPHSMHTWICLHDSPNLQPVEQLKNLHLGRPSGFIAASFFHSRRDPEDQEEDRAWRTVPCPSLPCLSP